MTRIRLLTIGFTQTTAKAFFETLRKANVKSVVDVRLSNESQLAAFAKKSDLQYFLSQIGNIGYRHEPNLAPTLEILDAYKKKKGDWQTYENQFRALLESRKIESIYNASEFDNACLLCSEHRPHHCHRRLVAEYLNEKWGGIKIQHLVPEGRQSETHRHRPDSL